MRVIKYLALDEISCHSLNFWSSKSFTFLQTSSVGTSSLWPQVIVHLFVIYKGSLGKEI